MVITGWRQAVRKRFLQVGPGWSRWPWVSIDRETTPLEVGRELPCEGREKYLRLEKRQALMFRETIMFGEGEVSGR